MICDITTEDFPRYKQLRSVVSNRLDTAKNRHLSEKLADAPDAREKWRELRKFGVVGKGLPSSLTRFSLDELAGHYATVVSGAHARPLMPEDLRSAVSELSLCNLSLSVSLALSLQQGLPSRFRHP